MRRNLLMPAVMLLFGGMPMGARDAHPKGPDTDKRPWVTRTFQIAGNHSTMYLTMSYPEPRPDGSIDGEVAYGFTHGDRYNAWEPGGNPILYRVSYPFQGHFWQGDFGDVGFHIELVKREKQLEFDPKLMSRPVPLVAQNARTWNALIEKPWDSISVVQKFWSSWGSYTNEVQLAERPENRSASDPPLVLDSFGSPCVQVLEQRGEGRPKDIRRYYFLFEPDYQIELNIELVDGSDRPGLTKSDWRPRAEAIADKILQSVKVRVEPMAGAGH